MLTKLYDIFEELPESVHYNTTLTQGRNLRGQSVCQSVKH